MTGTRARPRRVCSVAGCGRRHSGHGYCPAHLARLHRFGDVQADVPVGTRTAGGPTYATVHAQLRAGRGPATDHECAECGRAARCWSYDGTDPDERQEPTRGLRYSLDLDRYRPRCLPCHRQATNRPWRRPDQRAARRDDAPGSGGEDGPGCAVPGCVGRHCGLGYCHTHLSRLHRVGDVRADVPIEHKRTHGKVSYWSVHERLRVENGPPSDQPCIDCAAPAWCWSYTPAGPSDPGERTDPSTGYHYSLDLDRYRPRCRGCHRRATTARSAPRKRSAVLDVPRAVWLYERGVSAAGIGALMDVSRTAVLSALRAADVTIRPPGSQAPLGRPRDDEQARS